MGQYEQRRVPYIDGHSPDSGYFPIQYYDDNLWTCVSHMIYSGQFEEEKMVEVIKYLHNNGFNIKQVLAQKKIASDDLFENRVYGWNLGLPGILALEKKYH